MNSPDDVAPMISMFSSFRISQTASQSCLMDMNTMANVGENPSAILYCRVDRISSGELPFDGFGFHCLGLSSSMFRNRAVLFLIISSSSPVICKRMRETGTITMLLSRRRKGIHLAILSIPQCIEKLFVRKNPDTPRRPCSRFKAYADVVLQFVFLSQGSQRFHIL